MRAVAVVAVLMLGVVRPAGGAPLLASAAQVAPELGWVRVPSGTFLMGCVEADSACLDNERPRHEITFVVPFELMAAEVTARQYARFVFDTRHRPPPEPDYRQSARHPVVLVSWDDAASFCAWAGGRLPTEAEWEYAARGDRPGLVYGGWGDELSRDVVNYGADQCCAGATGGADEWLNTAPVRSFPPNDFGLYDMAGNVWEWVADRYETYYYSVSPEENPAGPEAGPHRILRGGSWADRDAR
ncbi:MAG: SUMF1/EgtB/PvdO family nonheme iron enzyme, partial [Vicinamibacterales bacterium]|nr:SUMF1/EgtB/PvdO family nonheme iron enzyme [Vicinamibacterales bacterium]